MNAWIDGLVDGRMNGEKRMNDRRTYGQTIPLPFTHMITSSNGNICYWPFVRGIHRSPVDSPHKGQWRGALIFSLISAWINGWANNRDAGDLRCQRAQYHVTVMIWWTMVSSCHGKVFHITYPLFWEFPKGLLMQSFGDFYVISLDKLVELSVTWDAMEIMLYHIDGLVQDCGISVANALDILQSCTKPSTCTWKWMQPALILFWGRFTNMVYNYLHLFSDAEYNYSSMP